MTSLPTSTDIEKLPMRAIVAYSARTSRRLSFELRGVIDDHFIDRLLSLIDEVCTYYFLGELDETALVSASADLAGAMSRVNKSLEKSAFASSLRLTALTALMTIDAANNPKRARRCISRAAIWAEQAVSRLDALHGDSASAAAAAARRDYAILVTAYGKHDDVTIGEPIDCFNDE